MILRDYQLKAIEDARNAIRDGHKRIIIHSGTGTGKTVIASEIARSSVVLGKKVVFLAHRKELIDQAHDKLSAFGISASVLMAQDARRDDSLPVCVASVQTLLRRKKPPADLLIIDECHRAPADSYMKIITEYPEAIVLGLTATPARSDSLGLGDLFDAMVSCPSTAEMMRMVDPETGKPYLVSVRVFAPSSPDLSGVRIQGGEYKQDDLSVACDKAKLVGSIVHHWKTFAAGRKTAVFATSIDHSKHIVADFIASGVMAEHLDGETPKAEREAILERLRSGKTMVVSNVGVLTEGWDMPVVSAVVIARPTKSMPLFLQMCGRALRPYPGKINCIVLDHANCTKEHGFVDDEREWDLVSGAKRKWGPSEYAPSVTMCRVCLAAFRSGAPKCPYCNSVAIYSPRKIQQEQGRLEELKRENRAKAVERWANQAGMDTKKEKYQEWLRTARERGYKESWAAVRCNSVFGIWPPKAWRIDV